MSSNLYPELVRRLKNAGCTFIREGRGSHEIWYSPLTKSKFTVPKNTVMRHTANKALKDAGLDKM